jgi:hypothetical protein
LHRAPIRVQFVVLIFFDLVGVLVYTTAYERKYKVKDAKDILGQTRRYGYLIAGY